jgi:hypothetical protein
MATLTGSKPKDTYTSLLKLSSGQASTTIKNVEDGAGNATALSVGTTAVEVTSLLITNTPTISGSETTVLVYDDADNTVKVRELAASSFDQVSTFSTIAVEGQSNVVADTAADTLTLVAGAGIAITTNASTDTITIASQSLGESVYARTTGTQTVTTTATPVTYAAVNNNGASSSFSFGSGFSLVSSNQKIQVTADGAVRVSVNIAGEWASNNSVLTVALRLNGTVVRSHTTPGLASGSKEVVGFTHVLACNALDQIDVVVSAVGDGITVPALSLVEVHKLTNVSFT